MSADTLDALNAALEAHIADEYDGDQVSGWVIVAEVSTLDMLDNGEGALIVQSKDLQSAYLTTGLLHAALHVDLE